MVVLAALDVNDLPGNHQFLYNCSMISKKWRNLIFSWLTNHFDKYNYQNLQFNYDNIVNMNRIIARDYFECTTNSPYKNNIDIKTITYYRFVSPEYYKKFVDFSLPLQQKHQLINTKFAKFSDTKLCKFCSTIVQAKTLCGNYLNKIRRKKVDV